MRKLSSDNLKKNPAIFATIMSLFLIQAFVLGATESDSKVGPNLIKNGGFEDGAQGWLIPANSANVVDNESHSGKNSLHYVNKDPESYNLFSQRFKLIPGQKLRFSTWIKVANIKGSAAICIQSYDSKGKYLPGSFAGTTGFKGTHDWQQNQITYTVPQNASSAAVILYIKKRGTGEVWFDDVQFYEVKSHPFTSSLLYPNYRGIILKGNDIPWKFDLQINKQEDWKNNPIVIKTELVDKTGKVLLSDVQEKDFNDKESALYISSPKNLLAGDYTLKQDITDPNGEKALQNQYPIHIVEKMPETYIDADNFTVVNGKRFFPLGLYLQEAGEQDLQRISGGGFNTILSYQYGSREDYKAYLERAQKNNLKVVYSLPGRTSKDQTALDTAARYIQELKNSPALLAWYTNDELGLEWLPQLQKMYDQVKQLDPGHPTFQVMHIKNILDEYFNVTDILGMDPYPLGRKEDITETSSETRATVTATKHARGVWTVPQMMDWATYPEYIDLKSHYPSLDEMRNQAYQAIINGATGLIFYNYFNMGYADAKREFDKDVFNKNWNNASSMAKEINRIIPVVLENNRVPLTLPEDAEIEVAAWQDGNELLIMFANPYYEEKSIAFKLPEGWMISNANQEEIKSTFNNSQATFTLPSVGSGIFRLVKGNN